MPTAIENGYTTYAFTDEELISAASFTQLQRLYIQTERSIQAQNLADLEYDPEHPLQFVKNQARLKGMVEAFDFLLQHELAEDAAQRWEEIAKQQRSSISPK